MNKQGRMTKIQIENKTDSWSLEEKAENEDQFEVLRVIYSLSGFNRLDSGSVAVILRRAESCYQSSLLYRSFKWNKILIYEDLHQTLAFYKRCPK